MDEDIALDLARQFREHINYTGDAEQFDQEVIDLIKHVEDQCAKVVEQTPPHLALVLSPEHLLDFIAAAVRADL